MKAETTRSTGYGLLIAFAGSLLDKADAEEGEPTLSFPDWLKRHEIPRLLERASPALAFAPSRRLTLAQAPKTTWSDALARK